MPKWKVQRVSPDTCDPPGCTYLEIWDSLAAPEARVHTIAAFERVCAAHADDVPVGVMQWSDGNWKDLAAYIQYQKDWFRRLNHTEWLVNNPDEQMPPQIASYTSDPVTPGSVTAPSAAKLTGLARAYSRNKEHNARKNQSIGIPAAVKAGIDTTKITWSYSGAGDARVLTVNCGGQLTNQQRTQAQSIADVQWGVGKVVVVA